MSKLTQLRLFLLILFISLQSFSAWAGAVSDAQQRLTQAYNQYYQAISSGPKTPAEIKALRDQIIAPAMQEVTRAMSEEADQVAKAAEQKRSIGLSSPGSAQGANLPASAPNPAVTSTPDVAIDGSDVPKELEFPGAAKGAPIPKPTDAGKYTGPYAP